MPVKTEWNSGLTQKYRRLKNRRRLPSAYGNGPLETKVVVNAAGVHADRFHNMVSADHIHITPRRGDYCLLDKTAGDLVSRTIFQLPGKYGKGVLVSPTVHGNIIVGPTAIEQEDREATATTRDGLDQVISKSARSVKNIPHSPGDHLLCGTARP